MNTIAALDIGTSYTKVIIADKDSLGRLEVLGFAELPSEGSLKRGNIINVPKIISIITKAIQEAELMAGKEVNSLLIAISSYNTVGINSMGMVTIPNRKNQKREITQDDIIRVIEVASEVGISQDNEIIHIIPQQFIVDGQDGISDPIGMSGVKLEVGVHLVSCTKSIIQYVQSSLQKANYQMSDLILESLASAEAILEEDEKELGAIVLNIGGGTTSIIIFARGGVWFTDNIPIGGELITKDLAIGLRLPIHRAESVKKQHGIVSKKLANDANIFNISGAIEKQPIRVSEKIIAEILEPRVEEIFIFIRNKIEALSINKEILASANIVLTGGSANLRGIKELSQEIFERATRIGSLQNVSGQVETIDNPKFATTIGLAKFSLTNNNDLLKNNTSNQEKPSFFKWIKDFFS